MGPPAWERACFNSPEWGGGSSPVKNGALSRLYYRCCCCLYGLCALGRRHLFKRSRSIESDNIALRGHSSHDEHPWVKTVHCRRLIAASTVAVSHEPPARVRLEKITHNRWQPWVKRLVVVWDTGNVSPKTNWWRVSWESRPTTHRRLKKTLLQKSSDGEQMIA